MQSLLNSDCKGADKMLWPLTVCGNAKSFGAPRGLSLSDFGETKARLIHLPVVAAALGHQTNRGDKMNAPRPFYLIRANALLNAPSCSAKGAT